MLRSSMLKRKDEKTVSQLFILTQVGPASETSWWRSRRAELRVVIDALMYEQCNTIDLSIEEEAVEGSNYQDSIRYMFPPPESLDKHLGGFASPGVTVTEKRHSGRVPRPLEPDDFLANIVFSCVICRQLCCE
jgi:hypothetical protein